MDFTFSEEQEELRALASRIFADRAPVERVAEIERTHPDRIDHQLWQELAKTQLLGVALAEEWGGLGFGVVEELLLLEAQGRAVAPVPLLPTLVLGAAPLAAFGGAELRERLLPAVCRGEVFLSGAFNAAAAIDATVDGDGWRLSGGAFAVPAAAVSTAVLVPARHDGGCTVFAVPTAADGVECVDVETTGRGPHSHMRLTDVRVPASSVVGRVGGGTEVVEWTRVRARLGASAIALGACEQALAITARYVSERVQFGRPLSTNQAVAAQAADAYIAIDCMGVTLWQAAWRLAEGLPAADQTAIAKFWSAEAGERVVHITQHLHGGMGADVDYPVHRYFLWVKELANSYGSAAQQLAGLGESIAAAAKHRAG